jgi:hypothetical protein
MRCSKPFHKVNENFINTWGLSYEVGDDVVHSYDILGARMLWKPKEARILKNFKKIYRSTSVIW